MYEGRREIRGREVVSKRKRNYYVSYCVSGIFSGGATGRHL